MWRLSRQLVILALAAILCISFVAAEWSATRVPEAGFFLLHTRARELMVGALCAFALHKHRPNLPRPLRIVAAWTGLGLILFAVFAFDGETPWPGRWALFPVLGTALIILFGQRGSGVYGLLAQAQIEYLGRLSYSAYLWHQPLFAFARHRVLGGHPSMTLMLALGVGSFLLAAFSYRFVEQPFRQRTRVGRRAIFGLSALGSAVVVVCALFVTNRAGLPERLPAELFAASRVAADVRDRHPCTFNDLINAEALAACQDKDRLIYLVGDSHLRALGVPLRKNLEKAGYNVVLLHRTGCLPIPELRREPLENSSNGHCRTFVNDLQPVFEDRDHPLVLAGRWRFNFDGTRYDNGEPDGKESGSNLRFAPSPIAGDRPVEIVATFLRQQAAERDLIVVRDIPEAGWHVPTRLYHKLRFADELQTSTSNARRIEALAPFEPFWNEIAEIATVVDPAPLVCDPASDTCITVRDDLPLYYDDDHPSQILAEEISQLVLDAVQQRLAADQSR